MLITFCISLSSNTVTACNVRVGTVNLHEKVLIKEEGTLRFSTWGSSFFLFRDSANSWSAPLTSRPRMETPHIINHPRFQPGCDATSWTRCVTSDWWVCVTGGKRWPPPPTPRLFSSQTGASEVRLAVIWEQEANKEVSCYLLVPRGSHVRPRWPLTPSPL